MSDAFSARPDPALSPRAVREDEAVRAALFEAVSDGIVLLEGLRIVDCNERACVIYERRLFQADRDASRRLVRAGAAPPSARHARSPGQVALG